jgi:hypothetical protein
MPIAGRHQKKLHQMTGLDMTGEEFDALPAAVRRKVRGDQQRRLFIPFSGPLL